jgi:hypothetical protein
MNLLRAVLRWLGVAEALIEEIISLVQHPAAKTTVGK